MDLSDLFHPQYQKLKIHLTLEKPVLIPRKKKQKKDWKPEGLWYGCGDGWHRWAYETFPDRIENHLVFILESMPPRIKKIRNSKQLVEFNNEYSVKTSSGELIDWLRVSQEYDGIEICPYLSKMKMKYNWYYTWDVASGCIWNNFTEVKMKKLGKLGKVKTGFYDDNIIKDTNTQKFYKLLRKYLGKE